MFAHLNFRVEVWTAGPRRFPPFPWFKGNCFDSSRCGCRSGVARAGSILQSDVVWIRPSIAATMPYRSRSQTDGRANLWVCRFAGPVLQVQGRFIQSGADWMRRCIAQRCPTEAGRGPVVGRTCRFAGCGSGVARAGAVLQSGASWMRRGIGAAMPYRVSHPLMRSQSAMRWCQVVMGCSVSRRP